MRADPYQNMLVRLAWLPGSWPGNLLDLGNYNRRREAGLMLIEEPIAPMDRRIHRKFLTHKGRALVGAIYRAMERMRST
jgi:hypothetical protein